MKVSRRELLQGLGGTVVALPFLDCLTPSRARAQEAVPPYAIFFRQACGVAAQQNTSEIGNEPERFWPTTTGPLTPTTMMGRAVDELVDYRDRLLIVGNVNYGDFDFGDGHAQGALQGLTARPPQVAAAGGDSEAGGESLDHRIGAEVNAGGRDSLFMYASSPGGWLGGPCISHRGAGDRRAAFHNPKDTYDAIAGIGAGAPPEEAVRLVARQASINDLLRGQIQRLLGSPKLSGNDRDRMQLHLDSIRDVETQVACMADMSLQAQLDGATATYESGDGNDVLATARLHMDVAVLAIACGYTRSAALQIGSGNDGDSRYHDPDTGQPMENFHYISHRRLSHDSNGAVISGSDLLHHKVDRQFAQTFKYLLDRLDTYTMPDGKTLLEHGLAVWYNDNANGPAHGVRNVPWILGGGAGGFLKQGEYVRLTGDDSPNLSRVHNTIGSAVGVRKGDGSMLDDFGDPSMPGGLASELLA
jgi:hypothetical protein